MNNNVSIDIQQMSRLFGEYRSRFVLFAKSYLRDEAAAEDIVMDTLLSFWEKRHELPKDGNNLYAYILTGIKHKSLKWLEHQRTVLQAHGKINKHQQRELDFRITSLNDCDPQELFSVEIMEIVEKTLRKFPEKTRRIFQMSRFEGKTNSEIADFLKVSVKTVEYHHSKVLAQLQITLKDYL